MVQTRETSPRTAARSEDGQDDDQRIVIHGVSWKQYETVRAALDHIHGLRMTYLEGVLEIMSPSRRHDRAKKLLARLIEIYAYERRIRLDGYGSTTFRKEAKERGLEPDECYNVRELVSDDDPPDIALEVVVTSGGIDKLEVYRGLEVPEVWFWKEGALQVHRLGPGGYEPRERSELLPELELGALARFVESPLTDQTEVVRAYVEHLRVTAPRS